MRSLTPVLEGIGSGRAQRDAAYLAKWLGRHLGGYCIQGVCRTTRIPQALKLALSFSARRHGEKTQPLIMTNMNKLTNLLAVVLFPLALQAGTYTQDFESFIANTSLTQNGFQLDSYLNPWNAASGTVAAPISPIDPDGLSLSLSSGASAVTAFRFVQLQDFVSAGDTVYFSMDLYTPITPLASIQGRSNDGAGATARIRQTLTYNTTSLGVNYQHIDFSYVVPAVDNLSNPVTTFEIFLSFGGAQNTANIAYMDNISISDVAPVPEPTAFALLGLGGLLLAMVRRRS